MAICRILTLSINLCSLSSIIIPQMIPGIIVSIIRTIIGRMLKLPDLIMLIRTVYDRYYNILSLCVKSMINNSLFITCAKFHTYNIASKGDDNVFGQYFKDVSYEGVGTIINDGKILDSKADSGRICYLTDRQLKSYGLSMYTEYITFIIGSIRETLRVAIINGDTEDDELYLSNDVKALLCIPPDTLFQIKKVNETTMELGPLVGVFVNSRKIAALCEGKSDKAYEIFTDAIKSMHGICCFFSVGDIDWEKKLVKAMLWENNRWISYILPLPRVIYDRCFGDYGRNRGMEFRKRLGCEYHVVNSIPKLGKWETIKALSKNPKLIDAIPETVLYHSYSDAENALKSLNGVYLKPDKLYKGKGIYKVSRESDASYKIESRTVDENKEILLPDLKGLDELLSIYSTRGGGYIIQKEITKAAYKGHPFDFRLLYQKNWQGLWKPSGISVRMGAPGSIITSPRSGGAVEEFPVVLKEVFDEDINTKNGIYENVINTGKEVAETIEREFGNCVELGLDMTIDIHGKVWIIEVNGKPMKVSIKWLNNPKMLLRCYKRPIEYAVYLTGFKALDTEAGG